jgi:hypothetical protein
VSLLPPGHFFYLMEYKIKAKPTLYKGNKYRSKLEARWACFFDLIGFQYEYEPCEFDGWTPDFIVYGSGGRVIYFEVKPFIDDTIIEDYLKRLRKLQLKANVILLSNEFEECKNNGGVLAGYQLNRIDIDYIHNYHGNRDLEKNILFALLDKKYGKKKWNPEWFNDRDSLHQYLDSKYGKMPWYCLKNETIVVESFNVHWKYAQSGRNTEYDIGSTYLAFDGLLWDDGENRKLFLDESDIEYRIFYNLWVDAGNLISYKYGRMD